MAGFSRKSAARLRVFLATHQGAEGLRPWGVTLTMPGDPIEPARWRSAWRVFRTRVSRLRIPVVWRIELQERGQPHIHMVAWVGPDVPAVVLDGDQGKAIPVPLQRAWWKSVDSLGAYWGRLTRESRCRVWWAKTRMSIPGAERRAAEGEELPEGDRVRWWRYLCAHQSKSKQAQLGWEGRQWGVLCGRLLRASESERFELTDRQYIAADRLFRRLRRSPSTTSHGTRVWFNTPSDSVRIVEWARAAHPISTASERGNVSSVNVSSVNESSLTEGGAR